MTRACNRFYLQWYRSPWVRNYRAQNTDTVYVANNNDGTVSVVNGGRCNGLVSSGRCGTSGLRTRHCSWQRKHRRGQRREPHAPKQCRVVADPSADDLRRCEEPCQPGQREERPAARGRVRRPPRGREQ